MPFYNSYGCRFFMCSIDSCIFFFRDTFKNKNLQFNKMKERNLASDIFSSSFYSISTVLFARFGGIIFTIILARMLKPELFGVYGLASSIALMVFSFLDPAINQTLLRYFSYEHGRERIAIAVSYLKFLFKTKILISIIVGIIITSFAYPISIYVFDKPGLFIPLLLFLLYAFLQSVQVFFEPIFYSYNKVFYLLIREMIFQPLRITLLMAGIFFFSFESYVSSAIVSSIIAILLTLFLTIYLTKIIEPQIFSKISFSINKKRVIQFLSLIAVGGVSSVFFSYIDIIMLGIFLPSEFVGYYKASTTLVFGVISVFAFSNVLLPVYTKISKERFSHIFNTSFKYPMMLAVPSTFGIVILAKSIIKAMYGSEYSLSYLPTIFLSFLIIENLGTGLFSTFFASQEKLKKPVILSMIAVALNIILNYFFITYLMDYSKEYALAGAAFATLISKYFIFFGSWGIFEKEFSIKMEKTSFLKPLFSSIIMFVVLQFFSKSFLEVHILFEIFRIILGVFVYFLAMFLIGGITRKDIVFLRNSSYFSKKDKNI